VPDRVGVQHLLLLKVGPGGDDLAYPSFELGELFIAVGLGTGRDQDASQVPEGLAVGKIVEGGVGERPLPGCEFDEQSCDVAAPEPAQGDLWPVDVGQGLPQAVQIGPNTAGGGVGQEPVELVMEVTAAAGSGDESSGGPAG
jgi:hypothetical protein